jgi:hypothetical protein
MARSLSVLRRRVVEAIAGGLSCRAAAQRFGVSASSAIRWRAQERREGDVRPKRQGGDPFATDRGACRADRYCGGGQERRGICVRLCRSPGSINQQIVPLTLTPSSPPRSKGSRPRPRPRCRKLPMRRRRWRRSSDDLWGAVEISERIAPAPRLTQPGSPRICSDTAAEEAALKQHGM